MSLEAVKTKVVSNGIALSGINLNGAFVVYQPFQTRILYRSGAFTANQSKVFSIECPSLIDTLLFFDTNNNSVYTFSFVTFEGVSYSASFNNSNYTALGNTKTVTAANFIIDKGTRVTITPDKAIQGMAMFCLPAYNIDIKDF